MRAKTRAVFLKHQANIRPNDQKRIFVQEWNQKSPAERTAWVDSYNLLQQNVETKDGLLPVWHAARAAVDEHEVERPLRARIYHEAVTKALSATRASRAAFETLRDQNLAFRGVELAQPAHSPVKWNWADNGRAHCVHRINQLDGYIVSLTQKLNGPRPPAAPDGLRRIPDAWFGRDQREILNQRDNTFNNTLGLPQGDGGDGVWLPWLKTSGGMATGFLWLKFDSQNPDGTVIDRVFRKDTDLDEMEWSQPSRWEGDIRDPDGKTPFELTCNASLQHAGLPYVVRMRGVVHRGLINNNKYSYKTYLEWCPHKDLGDFIHYRSERDMPIPEPFMWYVLEALAAAGCYMEEGQSPDSAYAADPEWEPIVHRDIKPGNIFLDAPDPGTTGIYPYYPKPVLGDFGLSFKTSETDPNSPRWYNTGDGTPGFMAPEQQRWINQPDLAPLLNDWKVNSKTDVFAVGMLLCLLTHSQGADQPLFMTKQAVRSLRLKNPGQWNNHYRKELLRIMKWCVKFKPADRPSFQQLLDEIRRHTDGQTGNLALGMRNRTATIDTRDEQDVEMEDTYAIGLCRDGSDELDAQDIGP